MTAHVVVATVAVTALVVIVVAVAHFCMAGIHAAVLDNGDFTANATLQDVAIA